MEYRVVQWNERELARELHPQLMRARPELLEPPFTENPVAMPDDFPFFFYILDGDVIAGYRRAVPDVAIIDGQETAWAWNFDLFIEPQYRGKGIGKRLVVQQVEEFSRRGIVSGAAFSAPATLRIYERLGFHVLGHAPRLALVRNVRPFLASRARGRGGWPELAPLGNAILWAIRRLRGIANAAQPVVIEPIEREGFAREFEKIGGHSRTRHWARDAEWLFARMGENDRLWRICSASLIETIGLAVIRDRTVDETSPDGAKYTVRRATAMDFAVSDDGEAVWAAMASGLEAYLETSEADMIDVVTSCPAFIAALDARGFGKRGVGMSFAYKTPTYGADDGDDELCDWHLTHNTSDGFLLA